MTLVVPLFTTSCQVTKKVVRYYLERDVPDGLVHADLSPRRTVALGDENALLLTTWRARQKRERPAAGERWVDTGFIFTATDGSTLREESVSERFAADLPRSASTISGTAQRRSCWRRAST
ncbi:hypothetical protein [Nonomuraea dietziae]|uniref:hypothetical protein n=1 Tax=Nonomuraea dietziae TaxID=65515 RepID=UPI003422BC73